MPVGKQPYRIRMEDESPFFIGGMWDVWNARETDALFRFTVLTTFPNEVSGVVHDQMRVIVQHKGLPALVGPGERGRCDILTTPPSEGWIACPVSRRVNSPKNDDAKLIESEPA